MRNPLKLETFRGRLLLLGLLVFVPVMLLVTFDNAEHRSNARAEVVRDIEALIATVQTEYMSVLDRGRQLAALLSKLTRIRAGRSTDCSDLFTSIVPIHQSFTQIAVTDRDGRIICSAIPVPESTTSADRSYFKEAVRRRETVVSEPLLGRISKRPVIVVATPYLTQGGEIGGIIIVSLDLGWLNDALGRFKFPPGSHIGITDEAGRVVARYPDAEKWVGQSIRDSALFREMLGRGKSGRFTDNGFDNEERIVAFARHATMGSDSVIWAAVPAEHVYGPIQASFIRRVSWFVLGALVVFSAAWVVGRRVFLDPLNALLRAAERIGKGDFAARSDVQGESEIGRLARSFDCMAERIQAHERDLLRVNRLLTILSEGNRAMLRSMGERELLQTICRLLVQVGGYRIAWIGLNEGMQASTYRATEGFGAEEGQFDGRGLAWADSTVCRALGVNASRNRCAEVARNILTDTAYATWRDDAVQRKYSVCATLPLRYNAEVIGMLSIYASEEDAFNTQELGLLQETADDVGFGIGIHRLRARHAEGEERFRLLAEHSRDGMWLIAPAPERIVYVSPAVERIWGRAAEEFYGNPRLWTDAIHVEDRARVIEMWERLLANPAAEYAIEYRILRQDGALRFIYDYGEVVRDDAGGIRYVAGVSHDITERKAYEEKIRHTATHDGLTGLPNRLLFVELIGRALPAARRANRRVAVLALNLDRLKNVNESLGHDVGDAVLRAVAAVLQANLRPDDTVARLGSDDFTILLPDLRRSEDASNVGRKLLNALAMPLEAAGHKLAISASLGIAIFPDDGGDAAALLRCSDTAMHRAKKEGGPPIFFFTESFGVRARERLDIEQALGRALESGEFSLNYQPQVEARTGRLCGVEALLRWERAGVGSISPEQFIPVAEETGLIVPIGAWVLKEACTQAVRWREEGFGPMRMGINLSARQFWHGNLEELVRTTLRGTGYSAELLDLEITESVVMRDAEETIETLNALRNLGVTVSLDDFGTGYSSLAYLQRFPIDRLKIDRSFVKEMADDPRAATLVQGVIGLAHGLGFRVVAEGVETAEQANLLKALHCDELQGYHLSRPLAVHDLHQVLRADGRLRRQEQFGDDQGRQPA